MYVPHNRITPENEANGETDTCTSKRTDPASRATDEGKSRLSADCINRVGKDRRDRSVEAAERNPHFTVPQQCVRVF